MIFVLFSALLTSYVLDAPNGIFPRFFSSIWCATFDVESESKQIFTTNFFLSTLQESLQVLAFSIAGARFRVGIIAIVSSIASTARSLVFFGIAPVFVLFFVVFEKHQRWK